MQYLAERPLQAEDLVAVRKQLNMTQAEFARLVGSTAKNINRIENGKVRMNGSMSFILLSLLCDPALVEKMRVPERTLPLRIWYLHLNTPCTLIDADQSARIVRIRNYVAYVPYRAFGVNTEPSYEDFEAFLESRCFPRERDNAKLVLRTMSLPFYDPLEIILRTEGRLEEDEFRLIVERRGIDP